MAVHERNLEHVEERRGDDKTAGRPIRIRAANRSVVSLYSAEMNIVFEREKAVRHRDARNSRHTRQSGREGIEELLAGGRGRVTVGWQADTRRENVIRIEPW